MDFLYFNCSTDDLGHRLLIIRDCLRGQVGTWLTHGDWLSREESLGELNSGLFRQGGMTFGVGERVLQPIAILVVRSTSNRGSSFD